MRLSSVFIRFYKSFNYDYLRRYHTGSREFPWEKVNELWYPYVRIPICPDVTTIVGANESGKSHLLTAIEKGITGTGIEREDFCRYSEFFSVKKGQRRWPDFGFEWCELAPDELSEVSSICKRDPADCSRFLFFRTNKNQITLFFPNAQEFDELKLDKSKAKKIEDLLPNVFRINAEVALPDTVPIRELADINSQITAEMIGRNRRFDMIGRLYESRKLFTNHETITKNVSSIAGLFSEFWSSDHQLKTTQENNNRLSQIQLAYDLICKVAGIDPESLGELYSALRDGKEGHVSGIIREINKQLETSLNFPHWWAQDRKFQLIVSPREFDLVFTIRDRTETEYSFGERSSGLKYFLSYYVQYLAHKPHSSRSEILLMDEPDTYLSSQGQQDLLKIFEAFAYPDEERLPVQVVYVTHSPFLIDKNHAERIRVLEKGISDEGTRVVKDAARNHYEPLRSAFGSFVAETAFIGNSNLMVEGISDQVLLAGASMLFRHKNFSSLDVFDLNNVTIVPTGSASSVVYMVYLAKGRDVEQPAVTVLLDSDQAGNEARKELRKGGPRRKQLLKNEFILQISELSEKFRIDESIKYAVEIEDLIPLKLCAEAARKYATDIYGLNADALINLTEAGLVSCYEGANVTTFDLVKIAFSKYLDGEYHIEKVGFARSVIDIVDKLCGVEEFKGVCEQFEHNMKVLIRRINEMMRSAERERSSERASQKVARLKDAFLRDHLHGARREEGHVLLENIEASLDQEKESDEIRVVLIQLRREFNLESDLAKSIENFDDFKERIRSITYAGRIATQEVV